MEKTPNEYTSENPNLLDPNYEHIAYFVGMARNVQHEYGDEILHLRYRENAQLLRIYDEPDAAKLWAQHIEEVAPNAFRTSHILVREAGSCLLYQHDFATEFEDPEKFILPKTLFQMSKLSKSIVQDGFSGILREETFEPITPEAFTDFYADVRWLHRQLHT